MPRALPFLAALILTAAASAASAQAPQPRQSIDIDRFMGRWYEIVRTPNDAQRNCHGANQTWARRADGTFDIALYCHRDRPGGRLSTTRSRARITDPRTNAKFEASFFGGIIKRQYWVIDRADNYDWMIASTADGQFVSILTRDPNVSASRLETLRSRARQLGLRTNTMQVVDH